MVRPSNRDRIVEAAVSLADVHGIRGITIDAVAQAAGMTKGGVQYHFASKEDMMDAVVDDIERRFESAALDVLGMPFESATLAQRLEAYVRSSVSAATGAGDLVVFMDVAHDDRLSAVWRSFQARWTSAGDEKLSDNQRVALLAADGLWMNDISGFMELTESARNRLVKRMIGMLRR